VIDASELTVKLLAPVVPKRTVLARARLVPSTVTDAPPPWSPALGVTELTVGGFGRVVST